MWQNLHKINCCNLSFCTSVTDSGQAEVRGVVVAGCDSVRVSDHQRKGTQAKRGQWTGGVEVLLHASEHRGGEKSGRQGNKKNATVKKKVNIYIYIQREGNERKCE